MSKSITFRGRRRNIDLTPIWATSAQPEIVIARKLARRFGLSIAHAATVARLAGIGTEGGK